MKKIKEWIAQFCIGLLIGYLHGIGMTHDEAYDFIHDNLYRYERKSK